MAKSDDIQARYQIEDDMGILLAEFCQKLNLLMHLHANHAVELTLKMNRDCAPELRSKFAREVHPKVTIDERVPKKGLAVGPATYLPVSWCGIVKMKDET